jgi:asparagine synthase (glutamine-hydrolysing)
MCRIFGEFGTSVSGEEMARVSLRQHHGGPDAQVIVGGDGWAVGVNRLAVVDPASGIQPYTSVPGVVAVLNGEIYNDRHLREILAQRGHTVPGHSDGAVIPALYAEFGQGFVDLLEGMFAIAVVDTRSVPTLLLSTDPVGMKPLYYSWRPDRRELRFSSEIPALLRFAGIDTAIDDLVLDEYLATKTPFGERTFYRGVQVLPPGTTATVTARQLSLRRRRSADLDRPTPATVASYGTTLRTQMDAEVSRLLQADVPVCVVTSGGLDSSLVTALAARHHPGIASFTIGYSGRWPHDERAFARQVSEHCGTRHHEVEVDPASFPGLLPAVVEHLGQPNADPITLSTFALFREIQSSGYTVALTGDAADELFGGYDRTVTACSTPDGSDWVGPYLAALAAIPRPLRDRLYTAEYRALLAERTSTEDRLAAHLRSVGRDRLSAITDLELRLRLPAYHLRRVDHLSMASSVEARLPFCQPSIVRLANDSPNIAKVWRGHRKRAVVEAARGILPDPILTRPKQPFTLPISAMLTPGTALMAFAFEVLLSDTVRRDGKLDAGSVRRLLEAQSSRPTNGSALAIWALLIYLVWLRSGVPAAASSAGRVST